MADNKVNTPPEKPFHKRFAGVPEKSAGFQTKDTRLSKQRCSALRRKMPGFFARDENIFYFSIRKNLKIILKNIVTLKKKKNFFTHWWGVGVGRCGGGGGGGG